MPVNVSRLRYWFAAATIFVVAVVAGFFFYARYRIHTAIQEIPNKLGVEVQQSTDSFSLSKSEGGHTIFKVEASKAVQYKQGGRAELHNVNIVVYGRGSNRYDRIYGSDFEYDPRSGDVVAKGEVHIDLEAKSVGEIAPGQGVPPDLPEPIHLTTAGMTFNQKTGMAKTDGRVEFRIPQANGSAVGATYDSKSNALILGSNVRLEMTGPQSALITAGRGVITKDPRRAVLDSVRVIRENSDIVGNQATLFLRDDNSIDHIVANGNVQASSRGESNVRVRAPMAEFWMAAKNVVRSAVMSGTVQIESTGASSVTGTAGRVTMDFGQDAKLTKIHASDGVRLLQKSSGSKSARHHEARIVTASVRAVRGQRTGTSARNAVELTASTVDFYVRYGRLLDRAETFGAAQIVLAPEDAKSSAERTVITAGKFNAGFKNGRISLLHGAPNARVVQTAPGEPEKVSTSDLLDATFADSGEISGFVQQGNFRYRENSADKKIDRAAAASKATYNNFTQILTLVGAPSVTDGGMTATAQLIRLNRRTGDAEAENAVKTTYNELKPQANGAMLASGDPVHVTAANMVLRRANGVARYAGSARLWQSANIIQAPIIIFDREKRSLHAEGSGGRQVNTVLVQQDTKGKTTPVTIMADRLDYIDPQRKARFENDVVMRSSDGVVTSERLDVLLKPSAQGAGNHTASRGTASMATPGKLDRAVAEGHVVLQQPTRKGNGEKLVYTADEGKFVLTGGHPSIYDAERGTVTGASLTFYNHDDRVLVEGGNHGRAVTNTRVSK